MTDNDIVIGLATIVVLGIGAQWLGRRTGIPSVLLLLPAGLLAGGVFDLVEPDELFGDLLFPAVTLLVSILLFQSGLQLRVEELPSEVRGTVARLVSVGLAITFLGASLATAAVLDVPTELAFMTGAVLVVSGPTVVGPLLRIVRPQPPTGAVLTWESTALDPVGATVGVVVLNLIVAAQRGGDVHPILQMLGRLGLGVAVGVVAAVLLVLVMSRFLVTDDMEAAVGLLFAVAAFAVAEVMLSEAGLFATLTLGFITANQPLVPTSRITGFGATVEVLVIGTLFVVLGATVELDALWDHAGAIVAIVAALVLLVRPLTAAVCLVRAPLTGAERVLVGCVDPRGIVAAATAAQFAGTLDAAGYDTEFLPPTVFGVILGTGVVYGLAVPPVARLLGLRRPSPTRVALIGDDPWLPSLGRCLTRAGAEVLLVSPDVPDGRVGDGEDLETMSLREGAERIGDELDQVSLARALISGREDAVVTLVEAQLIEMIGRRHVLRVPQRHTALSRLIPERLAAAPFGGRITRELIDERIAAGAAVEVLPTPVPPEALVLARVATDGAVDFVVGDTADHPDHAHVGLTPVPTPADP